MGKRKHTKHLKPGTWFQCDLCGATPHKDRVVNAKVKTYDGRWSRREICQTCVTKKANLLVGESAA